MAQQDPAETKVTQDDVDPIAAELAQRLVTLVRAYALADARKAVEAFKGVSLYDLRGEVLSMEFRVAFGGEEAAEVLLRTRDARAAAPMEAEAAPGPRATGGLAVVPGPPTEVPADAPVSVD